MWQCLDLHVSVACYLHRGYFVAGFGCVFFAGVGVGCLLDFVVVAAVLFSFPFVRVCFFFLLLFVLSVCLVLFDNCFI